MLKAARCDARVNGKSSCWTSFHNHNGTVTITLETSPFLPHFPHYTHHHNNVKYAQSNV